MDRTTQKGTKNSVKQKESVNTQAKSKGAETTSKAQKGAESGKKQKAMKENPYRDERGVRKLAYRRFKEQVDFLPVDPDEMVTILEFEKLNSLRIGRPSTFDTVDELQEAISDYWDYLLKANKGGNALIPDIEGLASFLGICRDTINEWERSNYKGFSVTIKTTKNSIAAAKKQLALHGKIPPIVFATDFNNNHGYVQKQQLELAPANPMGDMMSKEELEAKVKSDVIID